MSLPDELIRTPQWLVSTTDKVPKSPKTEHNADVRDSALYVSYEEACAYAFPRGFDVGFALTASDPFCVIDLDNPETPEEIDRAQKILSAFPLAYAELSRSGKGVHVWCRASVPRGVRRGKVELYSSARYMICTGNTLEGHNHPCGGYQAMVDRLFNEMGGNEPEMAELVEYDALMDDADLFQMAMHAVNGDKFDSLCRGDISEYPSQSEADYALMNMLCFYTRSNDQAKRLFRMSALGKRAKAWREAYVEGMIAKIRAEEAPRIDFSQLPTPQWNGNGVHVGDTFEGTVKQNGDVLLIKKETTFGVQPVRNLDRPVLMVGTNGGPGTVPSNGRVVEKVALKYPPGFLGEIAQYITATAIRPVREVSVAAAIGLCAGVVGRQFNISGTGLNQYIILLAKTGRGKDGAHAGIARMVAAVRPLVPVVDEFVGPGSFGSGQGLIRALDETPSFVSILGEFGLTLQDLAAPNADNVQRVMKRVLLDLYMKSGKDAVLNPTAYSDIKKNTKKIYAPAVTLLGESTPELFYAGLSTAHIADGLIPRFLIIEYTGPRPPKNPNAFAPPDSRMVSRFAELAEIALRMANLNSWQEVTLDAGAQAIMDELDHLCDYHVNSPSDSAIQELWSRAHLKALKLAALLAATDRPHSAVVNAAEAQWAVDGVVEDTTNLAARFESGDVGQGETKQQADMERILAEYLEYSDEELFRKYKVNPAYRGQRCVPHAYLQRRTADLSAFKNHKNGRRAALEEVIKDLMKAGVLQEVPKVQVKQMFGVSQVLFYLTV